MGSRRQSREMALQAIFQADFSDEWSVENVDACLKHFCPNPEELGYALSISQGVVENLEQVDLLISLASQRWSLSRMSRVDRSIIRIATFELSMMHEVPARVAINEAIEIAKRFGAEDSPNFVNGVLDKICLLYTSDAATTPYV